MSRAMPSPDYNPYAAPRPPGGPLPPAAPLPAGVRRVRLDPARYRAFVRARLIRFYAIVGPTVVVGGYAVRPEVMGASFAWWLGIVAFGIVAAAVRIRRLNARAFDTYELLVGPRAVRRTSAGFTPGEVLRPEVTAVYETRWGLWLTCDAPRCSLFVAGAVEGYDELRAALGAWRPIETLRGWAAWRCAMRESVRQVQRDAVGGTALAADPSLAQELEDLRRASSNAWMAFPHVTPARRRRVLLRLLGLWALMLVLFLAVWQFLAPPR